MKSEAGGGEQKRDRFWTWLLLYAGLTVVLLLPPSFAPHRRLPDDGDALQNLWIVWWGSTHLQLGYPEIYQANAYYPHPMGLVYSEPQFSQALLSWPFFNLLENRVLAYNLLVAVCLFLTAFATHLYLRELVGSSAAAFVGAVVYAFSSYSFSQLPRSQLVSLQWMPLGLFCLHRFFARERKRALIGFSLFSILLGLACLYYLEFYLIGLAILVPAYVYAYRSWRRPSSLAWLGASFAFIGATLLIAVAPYFEIFARYGFTGQVEPYDLALFFKPPMESLLYGIFDPPLGNPEQFLGFFALGLSGFGLVSFFRRSRREDRILGFAFVIVGISSFLLASGPDIIFNGERLFPGPYHILQLLGPFGNLRDPGRISVLTRLALALFVAAGVARLQSGSSWSRDALISSLLAMLLIGEQWSPRQTRGIEIPVGAEIPEAYRLLRDVPQRGPVAELPPLPIRAIRRNTIESYFATFHERPILVGKPSFPPPAFELLRWELRRFPDMKSTILLQALGIEHVLVHPNRWGRTRARRLEALTRRGAQLPLVKSFPDRKLPLWSRWFLGGEQLHAVIPLEKEGSPRACDCREIDRKEFRLRASGANDPSLSIDGDPRTKWGTDPNQEEGFFEVAFDRPRFPARIEIEMAFPYDEFARHLEVNGHFGPRSWKVKQIEDVWYKVGLIRQIVEDPKGARLRYDLEPTVVDRIRLLHRNEPGVARWSIPEIHVYESVSETAEVETGR